MPTFEYKTVTIEYPKLKAGWLRRPLPELDPVLNREAHDGWRLKQVLQPAEFPGDRRERSRDDGLVERRECHTQHQPSEDHEDLAVGEVRSRGGGCGCVHSQPVRSWVRDGFIQE